MSLRSISTLLVLTSLGLVGSLNHPRQKRGSSHYRPPPVSVRAVRKYPAKANIMKLAHMLPPLNVGTKIRN
ncbi:hypothetical protein BDR04DRAFT_1105510 [Suillus decipiens]|nr:hypothetical protein BDR04DRAFT_1105510 [Suillus decipiens]